MYCDGCVALVVLNCQRIDDEVVVNSKSFETVVTFSLAEKDNCQQRSTLR